MTEEFRFTAPGREIGEEDRLELTSVGVDIGSSTSHLIFSKLVLERVQNRYVTVERTVLGQSDILLTPYKDEGTTIDGEALGKFIDRQYQLAGLQREEIDTGALILTGVALLRENSRAIAELFAQETGKFVAVSAGDNLESTMAALGSGAAALSGDRYPTVLNIDVGGGTTKLASCQGGKVLEVAAADIGARLVVADENGTLTRLEESGERIGKNLGLDLKIGGNITKEQMGQMAAYMAEKLLEIVTKPSLSPGAQELMRTSHLALAGKADAFCFSGGVSEFIYGRERSSFGDLGPALGEAIRNKMKEAGATVLEPEAGIRATVIGASQYTVQVSGSTIFLSPVEAVPVRNIPAVAPHFVFGEEIDPAEVERAVGTALNRLDQHTAESAVAVALKWEGSATYQRIDSFCRGIVGGMKGHTSKGHPIVMVFDGDVGGLLGIHLKQELKIPTPVISIDGVELREFDYIDIGEIIPTSGAVPVVIKSLVFPTGASAPKLGA